MSNNRNSSLALVESEENNEAPSQDVIRNRDIIATGAGNAGWMAVGAAVHAINWIATRELKHVADIPKAPKHIAMMLLSQGPLNSFRTGLRLGRKHYDDLEAAVKGHRRSDGWGTSERHTAAGMLIATAGKRQMDRAEGMPVARDLSTTVRTEFPQHGISDEITEEIADHPAVKGIAQDTDVIPVAVAQNTVGLSDTSPFRELH